MLRVRIWPILWGGRGDSIFTLARFADDVKRGSKDTELCRHSARYGHLWYGRKGL